MISMAGRPAIVRLQVAMLEGKVRGKISLEGIGELAWHEFLCLAQVIVGLVSTATIMRER